MEYSILRTISFSKLFMVALLLLALFTSSAISRWVPTSPPITQGGVAHEEVRLAREALAPPSPQANEAPPSPQANEAPPGGLFGSKG